MSIYDIIGKDKITNSDIDEFEKLSSDMIQNAINAVDIAMSNVNKVQQEVNDARTQLMHKDREVVVKKLSYKELMARSKEENIHQANELGIDTEGKNESSIVDSIIEYFKSKII